MLFAAGKVKRPDPEIHDPEIQFSKPKPIEASIKEPLVSIVAEGDLVVLSFVSEEVDPKDATLKYTTTWFDMFRIADGMIVEHWDPALKR